MSTEGNTVSLAREGRRRSRVSIKDIARHLGLSITAVSRGLRDDPGIGEATRQRIKETASRMGYVPNPAGAALSTGRTFTALFVVPYDINELPHLFHMEVLEGVVDELSDHGYTIDLLFERSLRKRHQTIVEALQSAHADGAIVVAMREGDVHGLPARPRLPVVVVNYMVDEDTDCVIADDEGGAMAATTHLIEAGHRVIGHVAGPGDLRSNGLRRHGYEVALQRHGIATGSELVETGALTEEGGYRAMSTLLKHRPDLTAVFCCRDIMAVGAVRAVREAGRRVPEDISVVGFDDEVFASLFTPALTTVRKPRRQMGERAGRILLDRMRQGGSARSQHATVKTRLIKRGSVGPRQTGETL